MTPAEFNSSLRKYKYMKNTKTALQNQEIHDQTGEPNQDGKTKFHSVVHYPSKETEEKVA